MEWSRKDEEICPEGLKENRKSSVRIADNPSKIRKSHLPRKNYVVSNCSVFGSGRALKLKHRKISQVAATTCHIFAEHYATLAYWLEVFTTICQHQKGTHDFQEDDRSKYKLNDAKLLKIRV
jgi:5-methylcytosine-specific restriction endonuclease McrA